jgi:DNA-binding transcriptional LysR family regulator
MILVASPNGSGLTRLSDCADRDWVAGTLHDADRRLLQRWTSEFDINPRVRYETPDCHSQLALISSGLAVGLVPATLVISALAAAKLVEVVSLPTGVTVPNRDIFAVTRTRYWPPIIDDLIQRLIDFLELTRSMV